MSIFSLKNQNYFDFVNRNGNKKSGYYFIVILIEDFYNKFNIDFAASYPNLSKSSNNLFLGLKVSNKFSKKAVTRNKTKRRMRHLAQNLLNNKNFNISNSALILIPKKGFEKVDFQKLEKDFYITINHIIKNKNKD